MGKIYISYFCINENLVWFVANSERVQLSFDRFGPTPICCGTCGTWMKDSTDFYPVLAEGFMGSVFGKFSDSDDPFGLEVVHHFVECDIAVLEEELSFGGG